MMNALICEANHQQAKKYLTLIKESQSFSNVYLAANNSKIKKVINEKEIKFIFVSYSLLQSKNFDQIIALSPRINVIFLVEQGQKPILKSHEIEMVQGITTENAAGLEIRVLVESLVQMPHLKVKQTKKVRPSGKAPVLTRREIEILHYLSRGKSDREISQDLAIAVPTLKTHLRRIYKKTHTSNRAHCVANSMRWSII